ncbi:hypothetical protein [Streptococcus suis]|uniref:hypothetical protein n=1 Tax=Streptococcus suis TaxID=1307 RepID=UPI0024105BD3|nr:hypothetical protein [Streptococcus suis]MDG3136746.1 hypothetical protein [Streptococcus suis]
MTEALLSLSIFAVPVLAVAVVEQRKVEKERMNQEFEEIRRRDHLYGFKAGMGYRDECMKQRVLNTERQQVDKEEARYAEMVG